MYHTSQSTSSFLEIVVDVQKHKTELLVIINPHLLPYLSSIRKPIYIKNVIHRLYSAFFRHLFHELMGKLRFLFQKRYIIVKENIEYSFSPEVQWVCLVN